MNRLAAVVSLLLVLLLAACSAAPKPPPPPPSGLQVEPQTALPGDVIVITGTALGAEGTLMVGDVEAQISDWADGRVEAIVAAGSQAGPQSLTLTTAGGTASVTGFFVGAEYQGEADTLQAFLDGLDAGVAVLLQATTYALSGDLVVDNHGIYGRGTELTTLDTGTHEVQVLADFGQQLRISDMSIETDAFYIAAGNASTVEAAGLGGAGTVEAAGPGNARTVEPADIGGTGARDAISTRTIEITGPDVTLWPLALTIPTFGFDLADALRAQGYGALASDGGAFDAPHVHLSNLRVSEIAGGAFGVALTTTRVPAVALTFDNVIYDGANSGFSALSTAAISIADSDITSAQTLIYSVRAATSITNSRLITEVVTGGTESTLIVAGEKGVTIDGSTLRGASGDINVLGAVENLSGSGFLTGGPVTISHSSLEATDIDLSDSDDYGTVSIVTQLAPIVVSDDTTIRAADTVMIATFEDDFGTADITIRGTDIKVGVFEEDLTDPLQARPGTMAIVAKTTSGAAVGPTVTLEGNLLSSSRMLTVASGIGSPGNLVMRANDVALGDGKGDGTAIVAATMAQVVVIDGNTITSENGIQLQLLASSATVSANTLTLGTDGLYLVGDAQTDVTIDGNTVGLAGVTGSGLAVIGAATVLASDNTFSNVGAPGPSSVAMQVGTSVAPMSVTASGNTFENFTNALAFEDIASAALGIDAEIHGNVFDFAIDGAPKAAYLENVKDAIDATGNTWGTNTSAVAVAGYVTLGGDTTTQGGSIDVNPLTAP